MIFRTYVEVQPDAILALVPLVIVIAVVIAPKARAALMQLWVSLWR